MKKYFIFFCIAWIVFIFHTVYTKHAIYGDGNGYYSYTQALYFDKSLDFSNVYNYLEHFHGRDYEFSRIFWGKIFNPYSIGTGITWLPSVFLMSIFSSDRFSLIYELGPGLTGIISMLAGLYFLEKYLLNHFSKRTAFWTILALFFGSNILYYTAFEPALSHQPAFLIISLLLYLTDKEKVNLFLVGILCGILAMIRIGDTVLLVPIIYILRRYKWKLAYIIPSALLAYSPQLINQGVQFGSLFTNPYLNGANGNWDMNFANLINILFSPRRGFAVWTPIFVLGFYGLVKNKNIFISLTLLFYLLIVSFWPGGFSAGFGIRLMFSAAPYLAIGVAKIFSAMDSQKLIKSFSFFTVYNLILLFGFFILGWKNLP